MQDIQPFLYALEIAQGKPLVALLVTLLLVAWNTPALRQKVFSRVKQLPRWAQWVSPVALALAALSGQAYLDGARGWAILTVAGDQLFGTSAQSIAIWHVAKRLLPVIGKLAGALWRKAKPAGTVSLVGMALLAATSQLGCAVSLESARAQGAADRRAGATLAAPSGRCETLDSKHRWGGYVAAGAAFVGGGSGLSTVAVDREDKEWRYGLASAAVGFAGLAVAAELYARDAAGSWARECQR